MDIDALIVELIESGRRATEDELSQIVAHVAQASFASRLVRQASAIDTTQVNP